MLSTITPAERAMLFPAAFAGPYQRDARWHLAQRRAVIHTMLLALLAGLLIVLVWQGVESIVVSIIGVLLLPVSLTLALHHVRIFWKAGGIRRRDPRRVGDGELTHPAVATSVLTIALLAIEERGTGMLEVREDTLFLAPVPTGDRWPDESPEGRLSRDRPLAVTELIADWMADGSHFPYRRAGHVLAYGAIRRGLARPQRALDRVPLTREVLVARDTASADSVVALLERVEQRSPGRYHQVHRTVVAAIERLTVAPTGRRALVPAYEYVELPVWSLGITDSRGAQVPYVAPGDADDGSVTIEEMNAGRRNGHILTALLGIGAVVALARSKVSVTSTLTTSAEVGIATYVLARLLLKLPTVVQRRAGSSVGCAAQVAGIVAIMTATGMSNLGPVVPTIAVGLFLLALRFKRNPLNEVLAAEAVAERLDELARGTPSATAAAPAPSARVSAPATSAHGVTVSRVIPITITKAREMAQQSAELKARLWRKVPVRPTPTLPRGVEGFLALALFATCAVPRERQPWWMNAEAGLLGSPVVLAIIVYVVASRWYVARWNYWTTPRPIAPPHEPAPLRLLLLRVFNSPAFDDLIALVQDWEYIGPIEHLDGGDTVGARPDVVDALYANRLDDVIVHTNEQVQAQLQTTVSRNEDGRFARRSFQCSLGAWRDAIIAMMARTDAVVMDLSNFSSANEGSSFELAQLLYHVPLSRVTLLVSDTTDLPTLHRELARAAEAIPASSPNAQAATLRWHLVEIGGVSQRRPHETHDQWKRRADSRLGADALMVHLVHSALPPRATDAYA
jgi:hypothetical protein